MEKGLPTRKGHYCGSFFSYYWRFFDNFKDIHHKAAVEKQQLIERFHQGPWWATDSLCLQTRRKSGKADRAVQGKPTPTFSIMTSFAANDHKLTISSQAPQGKYSSKVAGGVKEEWWRDLGAERVSGAWLANIGTSHTGSWVRISPGTWGRLFRAFFSLPPFYLAPALLSDTAGAGQALALR